MKTGKTLIIATKNQKKFRTIADLIQRTGIKVRALPLPANLIAPAESGKTTLENAKIKANYYFKILQENVLAVDDGLFIRGFDEERQIGPNIKRGPDGKELSDAEIVAFWWKEVENKTLKAERIRSYFFKLKTKKEYKLSMKLTGVLKKPQKYPISINDKPLNYFLIPDGFSKPVSGMTKSERKKLQEGYLFKLAEVLKKLPE